MKIPTQQQYAEMVKTMPVKELMGLAETFEQSTTLNATETVIKNVIDAEVERRIYNWEMAQV